MRAATVVATIYVSRLNNRYPSAAEVSAYEFAHCGSDPVEVLTGERSRERAQRVSTPEQEDSPR
jgi:hypothetical protein